MKLSRIIVGLMVTFLSVVVRCYQLRSQEQTRNRGLAAGMNSSSKTEKLQKEMDVLKAQIEQLKSAQEKKQATPAAAITEAPTTPAKKVSLAKILLNSTTISGSVDCYYGYTFEHPADHQAGLVLWAGPHTVIGLILTLVSVVFLVYAPLGFRRIKHLEFTD